MDEHQKAFATQGCSIGSYFFLVVKVQRLSNSLICRGLQEREVWPFDCHSGWGWRGHQLEMDLNWRCSAPCRVGDSPALGRMPHPDSQQACSMLRQIGEPAAQVPIEENRFSHCPPLLWEDVFVFLKAINTGKPREIKNDLSLRRQHSSNPLMHYLPDLSFQQA